MWFAIVVAAPLFEEIFFRGFLFAGFQSSRLGNTGAILLTSLAWTVIHLQYEIYELSIVFVLGIILGIARLMSQSLYVPIAIHAFANLLATIELVIYVGMSGNGI
ncbi:MAG TPA: CPBP family intramembrane metalloprotease [Thioploca sp.]|nr:MAG: hypothetical protein DRR08_21095 [Gammaproteobacteria bacterium]HDN26885.1 CPBP family intramembrane metalloprotease [Thioploca sp.]